jgi:hypothetical protein
MKVTVEEIEDEYWAQEAKMPKARIGLLEDADEALAPVEGSEENIEEMEEWKEVELADAALLPPPTEDEKTIVLKRKRNHKAGDSAIGVSVLSVRGRVGSLEEASVDLRLDSCADISLISEEFHSSLKKSPPIREGHRMSLAQLTDKGTTIKGYCKLKILMKTTSGDWLVLEAEAYVVKGMSVPILLGEDFQLNYELGVSRNVESSTKILFRDSPYEVEASGVEAFSPLS